MGAKVQYEVSMWIKVSIFTSHQMLNKSLKTSKKGPYWMLIEKGKFVLSNGLVQKNSICS